MAESIAVFVDDDGLATSFFEPGTLRLYSRDNKDWQVMQEFPFVLQSTKGVRAVRDSLSELMTRLGECKILLIKEISGVPYNVLNVAGFTLLEVEGKPEDLLDDVLEREMQYELSRLSSISEPVHFVEPTQTEIEGNYYLNLKQVQNANASLSSKQILLPFLRNRKFFELELVCTHVPPWFEMELERLGLKAEICKIGAYEHKVRILYKTCSE